MPLSYSACIILGEIVLIIVLKAGLARQRRRYFERRMEEWQAQHLRLQAEILRHLREEGC